VGRAQRHEELLSCPVGRILHTKTHRRRTGIRMVGQTRFEAKRIDDQNGDTLWWDAICKEMKNVPPAFEVWEKPISELPPGHQKITGHMAFDVKMGENFRRKARFVADGHKTKTPAALCYSSVVSRDSVRIPLTITALNDLDILACDIQNACILQRIAERESGS
jgi:hypothetical protein